MKTNQKTNQTGQAKATQVSIPDGTTFREKTIQEDRPGISSHDHTLNASSAEPRIEPGERSTSTSESRHSYAHSKQRNGLPAPLDEWEPLFTNFDDSCATGCRGNGCPFCERLEPRHGHLNKVAWWTAHFAAEIFPVGPSREAAREWGYLVGLWHDLGKFSDEFQQRLRGERENANHSTAGAQHAFHVIPQAGQLLAYIIAGHHAGHHAGLTDLLNGNSSLSSRLVDHDHPRGNGCRRTCSTLLRRELSHSRPPGK